MTIVNMENKLPLQLDNEMIEKLKAWKEKKSALKKVGQEAHDEFWDALHEHYPALDREANYSIGSEYLDQGIAMLKLQKKSPLDDLMASLNIG